MLYTGSIFFRLNCPRNSHCDVPLNCFTNCENANANPDICFTQCKQLEVDNLDHRCLEWLCLYLNICLCISSKLSYFAVLIKSCPSRQHFVKDRTIDYCDVDVDQMQKNCNILRFIDTSTTLIRPITISEQIQNSWRLRISPSKFKVLLSSWLLVMTGGPSESGKSLIDRTQVI